MRSIHIDRPAMQLMHVGQASKLFCTSLACLRWPCQGWPLCNTLPVKHFCRQLLVRTLQQWTILHVATCFATRARSELHPVPCFALHCLQDTTTQQQPEAITTLASLLRHHVSQLMHKLTMLLLQMHIVLLLVPKLLLQSCILLPQSCIGLLECCTCLLCCCQLLL